MIDELNSLSFYNLNLVSGKKVILNKVSGFVNPGEILALMGPSGSGKSSLLNLLSIRYELLTGTVKSGKIFFGKNVFNKKLRHKIGYVMQNDVFFECLTFYETIRFYGYLRLSKEFSKERKTKIIEDVIDLMEMRKCVNTLVGGYSIKGLSGGERKRLAIAVELITDPEILMLDEPTSGLDSGMALSVIKILQKYAKTQNKPVIASIHQPNSQIFYSFDKLLLLSFGNTGYFGDLLKVVDFFKSIEIEAPVNWNAADFIIDVMRYEKEPLDRVFAEFEKINPMRQGTDALVEPFEEVTTLKIKYKKIAKTKKWPASPWTQFSWLSYRCFILQVGNNWCITRILELAVISFLVGITWFLSENSNVNHQNILGFIFFILLSFFGDPLFGNVFTFIMDKDVLSREKMSSMYPLSIYYMSKIISDIPFLLTRPLILTSTVYWLAGMRPDVYFLLYLILSFLASFSGQSLGLFIGSLGLSLKETIGVMVCFYIGCILFGGFYNNSLPYWIAPLRYVSPIYHAYCLSIFVLFSNGNEPICKEQTIFQSCINGEPKVFMSELYDVAMLEIPIWAILIINILQILIIYILTFFTFKMSLNPKFNISGALDKLSVRNLFSNIQHESKETNL